MERDDMVSPELQMIAVNDYCARRGYAVVATMEDLDLSGRFWKRRQVEQAIETIEQDRADVLVVWRWSRVSRNRLDWAIAVDRVEGVGGRLESATEGFDTTTSTGRFARGMLAEFAAFESDRMADIWREVHDRRVRHGLPGNGHKKFGYRKINGDYVVDKKTGPILADMYRRYTAGESLDALTGWLTRHRVEPVYPRKENSRAWGHQALARALDHGFGAGFISVRGELVPGAHQAVITPAEWEAFRQRRSQVTPRRPMVEPETFLLNGLVFCVCGRAMAPHELRRKGLRMYKCTRHRSEGRARVLSEGRLQGLVFRWLERLAYNNRYSAPARRDSQLWAQDCALLARSLAQQVSAGDRDPEVLQALTAAQSGSRWRDPIEIGRFLVEDWQTLTTGLRRAALVQLVERVTVRTGLDKATITVRTPWDATTTYTADSRYAFRCERAAEGTEWLRADEATRFAHCHRSTLRVWRDDGLLPLTQLDHYLYYYARSDLERILAAPRGNNNGVDHAALKAAIDGNTASSPA
jgi:DNA invertase Pin-like site-specific DNA recombinase